MNTTPPSDIPAPDADTAAAPPSDTAPAAPLGTPERLGAYDLVLAMVSVFSIGLYFLYFGVEMGTASGQIIDLFDDILCAVFFADFLYNMHRTRQRWAYFRKWGWIDLISSIPSVMFLRIGRLARVLRVLRVIRVLKSTKTLFRLLFVSGFSNTIFSIGTFALLAIAGGSCAILIAEQGHPEANIRAAGDAVWWAFITITTIGYGDFYPVTLFGRLVAVILGITGIGLMGMFTAAAAGTLLSANTSKR